VTKIPPIVARGVMIDVAGQKGLEALPSNYEITVADLEAALRAQNVDVTPGTVVLIRTGTARYWGENGSDHAKIASTTPPASASPPRAGWWSRRARWRSAPTPPAWNACRRAGGLASRRRQLQPGPRLPAREPGRAHHGVPQPRTARRRPGVRVRLRGDDQRHPRQRRRHGAAPVALR
jgi:hypothetical protein